ncbi:MAG: AraC family transcriptional regulator [Spirochaetes bacterium]|nr:AraC family transcriptional regulator [Spirochaetota bacterium]
MFLDRLSSLPKARLTVANHFPVEPGKHEWGPREIPDYELVLQVEGSSRYTDGSTSLTILSGEVLLIPPATRHTLRCALERPAALSCVHFTLAPDPKHARALRFPPGDGEVPLLFRRLAGDWEGGGPVSERLCEAMLCEILARLDRLGTMATRLPAPLEAALAFWSGSFRQAVGRREAARAAGVTPEYLSALFRKHLSTTPVAYLAELRFREARRLLAQGGKGVGEVARFAGFSDPLYFSRAFKKRYGIPPSRIRV